jgi:hypothetical protein
MRDNHHGQALTKARSKSAFGTGLTAQRSGMLPTLCDDLRCHHRDCLRADPDGRRQWIGGPGHVASALQVARPCRKPRATPRYQRSRSSVDAEGALNLAAAPDGTPAMGGRPGRLRAARQPARVTHAASHAGCRVDALFQAWSCHSPWSEQHQVMAACRADLGGAPGDGLADQVGQVFGAGGHCGVAGDGQPGRGP